MIMMKGVAGACVAFDPLGSAVSIMFFFPDGDGRFDGINDGAAGCEGCIAMGSGDNNTNGYLAKL